MRALLLVALGALAACQAHVDESGGAAPDAAPPAGSDAGGSGSAGSDAGPLPPGACLTDHDCGPGAGCCAGTCTNLSTLTDCGSCGNTCATGDFCDGTQCQAPTFPSFCANTKVYVIHDEIAPDDSAADLMASTITANCPATVMVTTADQTNAALVDQTTGQPLAGAGVTYVLGGGPFPDMPLRWLERTDAVTKVYFDAPDGVNFYWKLRSTGDAVATMPGSACSPHADQFVTELVTDPMSGTLSLIGYGACSGGKGTLAAAWYYANVLLPNKASYPDSWYVFSWSDTNGNATPDAADTFTVLAHGT